MLNIVIPMAGRGSRFSKAGHALPKPLLPVLGRPMIEAVIALEPNPTGGTLVRCSFPTVSPPPEMRKGVQ